MPAPFSTQGEPQPDWLDEIVLDDNALDDRRKLRNWMLAIAGIPLAALALFWLRAL